MEYHGVNKFQDGGYRNLMMLFSVWEEGENMAICLYQKWLSGIFKKVDDK